MAQYRAVQGSDVLTERRASVTHLALDPSAVAWTSSDRPRRRHCVVLASGLEPTARRWKPPTSEQTSSYAIPPKVVTVVQRSSHAAPVGAGRTCRGRCRPV